MDTPIKFLETKTFLNGHDINCYAPATIYNIIEEREAYIKRLSDMSYKPKSLVSELIQIDLDLQALITFLDNQP